MCLDERGQKGCYLLENTTTRASQAIFFSYYFSEIFFEGRGDDRVQRGSRDLGLFMQLLADIQFKLDQSDHSGMSPGQMVGINLPGDSLR